MRRGAALALAAALLGTGFAAFGAPITTPAPLPPPTAGAPPPPLPPGSIPSPILTRPGGLSLGPQPTYPAPAYPAPLAQQQRQSYRIDLLNQRRALEREGVSPANPRYRELQQQLNQLGR
ncbi:MAG: hypothetical protein ACREE4_06295 [Stellaceae bacterium]